MIEKTTSDSVKVNNRTFKAIQSGKKKSLAEAFPEIAAEWHPTKNGDSTPEMFMPGSNKKVWWQCKYGHEWYTTINHRTTHKSRCPCCSKNGTSKPELILLHYTRKHISSDAIHRYHELGFEIDIYIPELCIGVEYDGYRHLGKENKDITKNKKCLENNIKLYRVREAGLSELNDSSVDYFYKYGNDTAFSAVISKLLSDISGTEIKVNVAKDSTKINDFIKYIKIKNSLADTHPNIAKQWHPTKNGVLTPEMVLAGCNDKFWWLGKCGHEWEAKIANRTAKNGTGCPYCAGQKVKVGFNDLVTTHPDIAAQWHPDKNGTLTPEMVSAGSNEDVWWKCSYCEYEYHRRIDKQTRKDKKSCCPNCKTQINTIKLI